MLQALRDVDLTGRPTSVCKVHRELLVYFANQVHRMDYPSYRAKGWQIGSGPVESACKQVVGQRMKGAACVGVSWARMRSVTSVPCSAVKKGSGTPTGTHSLRKSTNINDAHPVRPDRNVRNLAPIEMSSSRGGLGSVYHELAPGMIGSRPSRLRIRRRPLLHRAGLVCLDRLDGTAWRNPSASNEKSRPDFGPVLLKTGY